MTPPSPDSWRGRCVRFTRNVVFALFAARSHDRIQLRTLSTAKQTCVDDSGLLDPSATDSASDEYTSDTINHPYLLPSSSLPPEDSSFPSSSHQPSSGRFSSGRSMTAAVDPVSPCNSSPSSPALRPPLSGRSARAAQAAPHLMFPSLSAHYFDTPPPSPPQPTFTSQRSLRARPASSTHPAPPSPTLALRQPSANTSGTDSDEDLSVQRSNGGHLLPLSPPRTQRLPDERQASAARRMSDQWRPTGLLPLDVPPCQLSSLSEPATPSTACGGSPRTPLAAAAFAALRTGSDAASRPAGATFAARGVELSAQRSMAAFTTQGPAGAAGASAMRARLLLLPGTQLLPAPPSGRRRRSSADAALLGPRPAQAAAAAAGAAMAESPTRLRRSDSWRGPHSLPANLCDAVVPLSPLGLAALRRPLSAAAPCPASPLLSLPSPSGDGSRLSQSPAPRRQVGACWPPSPAPDSPGDAWLLQHHRAESSSSPPPLARRPSSSAATRRSASASSDDGLALAGRTNGQPLPSPLRRPSHNSSTAAAAAAALYLDSGGEAASDSLSEAWGCHPGHLVGSPSASAWHADLAAQAVAGVPPASRRRSSSGSMVGSDRGASRSGTASQLPGLDPSHILWWAQPSPGRGQPAGGPSASSAWDRPPRPPSAQARPSSPRRISSPAAAQPVAQGPLSPAGGGGLASGALGRPPRSPLVGLAGFY